MMKPQRKNKIDLTQGSVPQKLFTLGGPMVVGMISVLGFNLTDAYFISLLGTKELAAVSYTFPISSMVFAVVFGLGLATNSLVSRSIGASNDEEARTFTTHSISFSLLLAAVFVALGLATMDFVFGWMGAKDEILLLVKKYMVVWYAGMIFVSVPIVGNHAIRATGDTVFPALIMVFAALANGLFDYMLIFGRWGAPEMGIQGAAVASVLARFFTLIASLLILHFRERMIDWSRLFSGGILASWKVIVQITAASSANNLILPLSMAIVTKMLAHYGEYAVAAYGVVSKIENFVLIPMSAGAFGMAPLVGQSWGSGQKQRVWEAFQWMFRFCMVYGAIIGILFYFWGEVTVQFFDRTPELVRLGTAYLQWVPWSYAMEGVLIFCNISFNALGKPVISLKFTSLRMFILYIPLAYLLSRGLHMNAIGIFIACSIANLISGMGAFHYAKYRVIR
ncbi:MAG: MATE family efflux transporter [Bdellovibrionota bacterium]